MKNSLGKRVMAVLLAVATVGSFAINTKSNNLRAMEGDEGFVEEAPVEVVQEVVVTAEEPESLSAEDPESLSAEEPENGSAEEAEGEEQNPARRIYIFYEQDDITEIVRMEAVSGEEFDVPEEPKIVIAEEADEGEPQYLNFRGWFYKTELEDGTIEETEFDFPLEFTETSDLNLYARYDEQPVKDAEESTEEAEEIEEQEEEEIEIIEEETEEENPAKADVELVEGRITARADNHLVTVSGMLPLGASLKLVAASEEEVAAALAASGLTSAEAIFAYDISIVNAEGIEWQPEELPVSVAITGLEATEEDNTAVIHVDDAGEVEKKDVTVENGVTSFEADSFSLYIIATYTVDFYYGEAEFHLNGGTTILLSELFAQLGIDEDATTAEVVEFLDVNDTGKDPCSLVKFERLENGDWLITSLGSFTEWFTLHIELSNGNVYDIGVTDAIGVKDEDIVDRYSTLSESGATETQHGKYYDLKDTMKQRSTDDPVTYKSYRNFFRTRTRVWKPISKEWSGWSVWGIWAHDDAGVTFDDRQLFGTLYNSGVHVSCEEWSALQKFPIYLIMPDGSQHSSTWQTTAQVSLSIAGSSYWYDYSVHGISNINENTQTSIKAISVSTVGDQYIELRAHPLDDIPQTDYSKVYCTVSKKVGICDEPSTNQVWIYLNNELIEKVPATQFCSRYDRQTSTCSGNNNDTINVVPQPGYTVDRIVPPSNGANVTDKDKEQRNEPFKVYLTTGPQKITVMYRLMDEAGHVSKYMTPDCSQDPSYLPGISNELKNQIGDMKKVRIQPRSYALIRDCSVGVDSKNQSSAVLKDYPGHSLKLHCDLADTAWINVNGDDRNTKSSISWNAYYDYRGYTICDANGNPSSNTGVKVTEKDGLGDMTFTIGTKDAIVYVDYVMMFENPANRVKQKDAAIFDCYDITKSMFVSGNPFTNKAIYGYEDTDWHSRGIFQLLEHGQINSKYKTITENGITYEFVKAGIGLNLASLDRVYYLSATQDWWYTYEMPIYAFSFKTWQFEKVDSLTWGPFLIGVNQGMINLVYRPVNVPVPDPVYLKFHGNPDTMPTPPNAEVYPLYLNKEGTYYEVQVEEITQAQLKSMGFDGYKLLSWNTKRDGSGTSQPNGGTIRIPASVPAGSTYDLYGQWSYTGKCTARFWKNDGTDNGTPWKTIANKDKGTQISMPTDKPTRDGYKFTGWYLDPACTQAATFPYTLNMNAEFFAGWVVKPEGPDVTDYSGTYDGTAHKATVDGSKKVEYSTDGKTWSETAPSRTDVGTTKAWVRYAGEPDTEVEYTITITARAASFTGAGDTITYDGKEHSYTAITPANLVSGHTYSGLSYSAKGTDAGTYPGAFAGTLKISDAGGNDVTSNYTITKTPGTLVIKPYGDKEGEKVTVTITGKVDNNKSYTGTEQSVSGYTFSSDNALYTESLISYLGSEADKTAKGTDASTEPYKMALTEELFTNISKNFSNVEFVVNNGQMTIKKAELTVTTGSASKIYDGTALTDSLASIEGFVNDEGKDVTITATGSIADAGETDNTYSVNWGTIELGTDGKPVNYSIKENLGKLTVSKVPAEYGVKMIVTGNTLVSAYTGTEQSASGYTYTVGTASEPNKYTSLYTDKCFSFSGTDTVKRIDAGITNMNLAVSQFENISKNFESVTFEIKSDGFVDISPAPLTIVTGSASKTYDGEPLTSDEITITGIQNGETFNTVGVTNGTQTVPGTSDNTFDISKIWTGTAKASNYSITPENVTLGTLTVNTYDDEVVIHVKGTSAEKFYDGKEESIADFEFVSAGVDFFDKDNISYNGTPAAKGKDAGSYAMGLKAENFVYSGTYFTKVKFVLDSDGVLTIKPAPVTVTTGSSSRDYNGKPLTNSEITVLGIVEGETYTAATTGTITTPGTEDNTYVITWGTAKSTNYAITDKLGTLTVSKVMGDVYVTITGNNSTATYDAEKHTVSGWTMTETTNDAFLKEYITIFGNAHAEGTDAGTHLMNLSVNQFSNNRTDLFENVVFIVEDGYVKINPAELTIKAASKSKTFDGKPLTPVGTVSGWIKNELAPVSFLGEITNAGTSPITYLVSWDDALSTAKESNYSVKSELGNLTINKVKLEDLKNAITVSFTGNSDSKKFNASEQSVTGFTSTLTKAINNKGEEIPTGDVIIALADGKSAIAKGTEVGTYYMGLSDESFKITSSNYEPECFTKSVTDGKLSITKASSDELEKLITVYPYSGIYDANEHGQAAVCTAVGTTTITYSTDGGNTWKSEYPTVKDADDSCKVIAKFENPNYETLQKEYSLTVTRKAATVSAVAAGKVYGETDPELSASVSGTLGSDELTYTVTRAAGENVGTYKITPAGEAKQGNYDVTYKTADFTITTSKNLTILNLSSLGYKAPYDGNTHGMAATVNTTEGTTISYKYSTDNGVSWTDWSTEYPTIKDLGKILVKVKAENTNFDTAEGEYTLEVTYAQATVKAKPVKAEYGQELPTPEAEVIGFIDGDPLVYTVKYSPDEKPTEAGKYDIVVSGAQYQGNYEITYVPSLAVAEGGGLEITPKPITVKITGNNGTFEYNGTKQTVSGFTTDAPEGSGIVVTLKEGKKAEAERMYVGRTDMKLTADMFEAASSNYDVTLAMDADGYIEITRNTDEAHKIIITAESNTWEYDGQIHDNHDISFTHSENLFDADEVQAEVATVSIKNVGTEEIPIISYKITNSDGIDITDNYTVEAVTGALEITKRPVTLTSATASKEYDSKQLIAYEVDVSGHGTVAGESFKYDFTGKQTLKGSSKNTFTAAENGTALLSNYDITYVFGDLTVTYDKGDVMPEKTALDAKYKLGDVVEFQIKIHNITDKPLENVVIREQDDAYFIVGGEHVNTYTIANLEADQTVTVKAYHEINSKDILNGSYTNSFEVPGKSSEKGEKTVNVDDLDTTLVVEKTADTVAEKVRPGDKITYTITVTNKGNVPYNNVHVDDELVNLHEDIATLAAGASEKFIEIYTVTEADMLKDEVVNVATAEADSIKNPKSGEDDTPKGEGEIKNDTNNKYQLTIHYVYEGGTKAADDYVADVKYDTNYNVSSVFVKGYLPSLDPVTGTMPAKDVELTVTYYKDPTQTKKITYSVEYYQNNIRSEADSYTKTETVWVNDPDTIDVTIDSSEGKYAGMTLDRTEPNIIPTKVKDGDVVKLFYVTNTYHLVIHYTYAKTGEVAAPDVDQWIVRGQTYNVASPAIEGYTPSNATVSGTMRANDTEVTVVYEANTHTITYKIGGEADYTEIYKYGDKINPYNPSKPGYHIEWSKDIPETMGDQDIVITGKWVPYTYTFVIHYVYEDGTPARNDIVITGIYGSHAGEKFASPVFDGYKADMPTVVIGADGLYGNGEMTVTYRAVQKGDPTNDRPDNTVGLVLPDGEGGYIITTVSEDEVPLVISPNHKDSMVPFLSSVLLLLTEVLYDKKRKKYQERIYELEGFGAADEE